MTIENLITKTAQDRTIGTNLSPFLPSTNYDLSQTIIHKI